MSRHCKLRSQVSKLFTMSRHCCCDVARLNVDVALLLRLCSNVATLSCDVATLTCSSTVMCDVVKTKVG